MSIKKLLRNISKAASTAETYSWVGKTYWRPILMPEFEKAEEILVTGHMVVEAVSSPPTLRLRKRGPRGGRRKARRVAERERWLQTERAIAAVRRHQEQEARNRANRLEDERQRLLREAHNRNTLLIAENPEMSICACGRLSRRRCFAPHCFGDGQPNICRCIDLRTKAEMVEFERSFQRPGRGRRRGGASRGTRRGF